MKIHPLRIGRTKVPFGQFYGGLSGFSVSEFAEDKGHFIWVPIHAYLLEHPTAGPVLVDAGISPEQTAHVDYYRGSIVEHVMDVDEYDLPSGQTVPAQLARLGYRPEDIRAVIITHLHEDHVGALNLFAHAPVYLGAAEYAAREEKVFGLIPLAYPPSIAKITDWRPISFTGPAIGGFTGSADLFGDGSVLALPTPGHSPGSTSVLVDHRFLLTGDAMYTIRHLAVDQVRSIQAGDEGQYVESVRRIQWLRREFPELVVLTAHDHTGYGERLIAGLAGGELSDVDLAWAKSYERATFDELANLNPARLPRFVPAGDGGPVGHAA
ncbi:N-acyl homoserine lactonase family protein [Amycolatopsis saalfeldensis]|uniref:Glyoxylase, beta-lactamase superfamily II n=1 Tax=Amycolatopsis saalfeldensis TaxID=394193 RepID=A0A1H8YPI5_9PSEU|nr:N-acyl homoserine lactonase family protein [Amycolatopsis saalfeldensis]SEP54124.1 Glyoxylase, beta-lactamase superfamily II [Amycolatopsis saalfeldensis]